MVPMNHRVLNKQSHERNISGSLMTTYITLLALLVEHSLVHWYQQCVAVHHVPKFMSCHKAIMVLTGRAHCFHDYIYIMLMLLL